MNNETEAISDSERKERRKIIMKLKQRFATCAAIPKNNDLTTDQLRRMIAIIEEST